MTYTELKESLYLQDKHKCCDDAEWCLEPPHNGRDSIQLENGGKITIKPSLKWYIVDTNIPVKYCPFCGIRL